MTYTPETIKGNSEHDGTPCIHFTDEDRSAVQVHQRQGAPGFFITTSTLVNLGPLGQVYSHGEAFLTHAQAQELCAYFKAVL